MGKRLIKMWFWNGIIANIVSNNPIEITNIPADKFLMLYIPQYKNQNGK